MASYAYGARGQQLGVLMDEDIQRRAPSVMAGAKHESRSERYTYIPTIEVVHALREHGWVITKAMESRARNEDRFGFTKHMLRARRQEDVERTAVGEEVPEVIIVNSHDGTSSYQLHAGMWRFVCSNGLMVGEALIPPVRVRHRGDVVGNVIEGVYEVMAELPKVQATADDWKRLDLRSEEQEAFAYAAMQYRFDDPNNSGFTPRQFLQARRQQDVGSDLWRTYNRVQENMIKGGARGTKIDEAGRPRRTSVRAVKSVDTDVKLNKALWVLAEAMAGLRAA